MNGQTYLKKVNGVKYLETDGVTILKFSLVQQKLSRGTGTSWY